MTHLGDQAGAPRPGLGQRLEQGHAFVQGGGQRFLHQHVFGGLQGLQAQGVVEACGCRNLHGIHVSQHKIQSGGPRRPELGGDLGATDGIGVHHCRKDGSWRGGGDPGVVLPKVPHPHYRNAKLRHDVLPTVPAYQG